jgi:hypothetical protein
MIHPSKRRDKKQGRKPQTQHDRNLSMTLSFNSALIQSYLSNTF